MLFVLRLVFVLVGVVGVAVGGDTVQYRGSHSTTRRTLYGRVDSDSKVKG